MAILHELNYNPAVQTVDDRGMYLQPTAGGRTIVKDCEIVRRLVFEVLVTLKDVDSAGSSGKKAV